MCRLVQAEENVADAGGLSHIIYVWITKSVCSLLTAGEAGGLKYRRTVRNHFKVNWKTDSSTIADHEWLRNIVVCSTALHNTWQKKVFGPSQGMSHSWGGTRSIISSPCVTDSMELFISRLRETHQRTPCACTNHGNSVLYWSRPSLADQTQVQVWKSSMWIHSIYLLRININCVILKVSILQKIKAWSFYLQQLFFISHC